MASRIRRGTLPHPGVVRGLRGGWARIGMLTILLFTGLLTPGAQAELNFEWAVAMGSTGSDLGHTIAVDGAGNVYTTGCFSGTADFDPGPGSFNLTSAGLDDIFVQKLDANGRFVWAYSMGGTDYDCGRGIAVDSAGNVYITGFFSGTVDLDPGPENLFFNGFRSWDIFIQKLDVHGHLVWARAMGGSSWDRGFGIALDDAGNVYTTGSFRDTVDFDPGPGVVHLTSAGAERVFVSKLDANGNFVWARAMSGTGGCQGYGIAIDDAGNVYVTGHFSGTVDFDPDAGAFNLSSAGNNDIFVQKLDANGDFVWTRSMGGPDRDEGLGIAVDSAGNVYTTGSFQNTVDFDPGPGTFNLTSAGFNEVFVQKLDADGHFVWAHSIVGTGTDTGHGIAVDGAGGVYTTGHFQRTVDFDPGPGVFDLISAGSSDIFVQKLDDNGEFISARSMGGMGWDVALGVTLDGAGNVYATGYFGGTADFDSGPNSFNLTSAGDKDIFVVKLRPDGTPPNAISINPSITGPTNASSLNFAVVFTEAVVNFDDASDLVITHSGTASTGTSIAGGPALYTVTVEGISSDGSFTLAVDTASDVEDLEGNPLASSVTSAPVVIDNTPPNAVSISPATTGPTNATSVDFTVTFDEAVESFGDASDLVIAHNGTASTGVSITGGPEVYTVTVEGITGTGMFTLAVDTASAVADLAGNALATSVSSGQVTIDTAAPKAVLLSPTTTGPSNAETMAFTVAFDEPVQDFNDVDDLVIAHSGTAHSGATITGGPAVYTVVIEGISGSGAFTLSVNTASDVSDLVGNPLALSVTSAAVVIDNTAPHATSITPSTTGPTNASTVDFAVTLDKPVQDFDDNADLVITHTGTASTGATITGGPESYTVTIEGISGDGSFTLAVDTASDVADLVGNPLASSVTSAAVAIDNTPPTINALTVSPSALAPGDEALIQFSVSEMLLGDPLVTVAGAPAVVAPLEAVKSLEHHYGWTAPADAPLGRITGRTLVPSVGYFNPDPWPYGPRPIAITLTDLAGNTITHTESEGFYLVSGLPLAWPGLAALALLFAAAFVFRTPRKTETPE